MTTIITAAIITAPRDRFYLTRSLDSYFKVWDIEPAVFAEPNSRKDIRISQCFESDIPLGIEDNWRRAAEWSVGQSRPYCLLMEDDIEWHSKAPIDLRQMMRGNTVPSGFVSPYCSLFNQPPEKGWTRPGLASNWCGNLALLFRTEQLKLILEHELEPPLDLALGHVCRDLGLDIIVHRPTYIRHIGEVSCRHGQNGLADLEARLPCLS